MDVVAAPGNEHAVGAAPDDQRLALVVARQHPLQPVRQFSVRAAVATQARARGEHERGFGDRIAVVFEQPYALQAGLAPRLEAHGAPDADGALDIRPAGGIRDGDLNGLRRCRGDRAAFERLPSRCSGVLLDKGDHGERPSRSNTHGICHIVEGGTSHVGECSRIGQQVDIEKWKMELVNRLNKSADCIVRHGGRIVVAVPSCTNS